MAKKTISNDDSEYRPALTNEGRENQLIGLAVDLAEKQLREGTASSQVITHYLKLAASKEKSKIEMDILKEQKELISAKTDSIRSAKRMDELYEEAMKALSSYTSN